MIFKSHIYDRSEIKENFNWGGFIFLLLLALLGYLLKDINQTLASIVIILSIIGMLFDRYKDWGKKEQEGKYVGELILTEKEFVINKEKINVSDITELKFEIGYPKGFKHWHRYGYTVSSGTTSRIELISKGQKIQFNFQLFSDSQLKEIKPILEQFYLKGLFVKEFYLGNRTYLLKELEYEEIQEFKKKYNLKGS